MTDDRVERKPLRYVDFNLRFAYFNPADGTFKVWVEGETPGGAMSPNGAVALTYDPKAFWKDPILGIGGLLDKLDRRSLPKEDLFELGKLLADLALPEKAVRPLFEKSLAALKDDEGLRLRLHIDVPELTQLPWEFMHLSRAAGEPQPADFLTLRREISIVRTDTVAAASRPLPSRIPRIVGVLSRPQDQDRLNVDKDRAALDAAVKAFNQDLGQELIRVTWVEKPATRPCLIEALKDGADVFQFSGHATFELGQEGKLILEDQDNKSDRYPAAQLAQLLGSSGVRLVVLSACESGRRNGQMVWSGVAPALTRQKIAAVVANQFDVLDSNAIALASCLYPRLFRGFTLDEALFEARQAIYQMQGLENRDWGALVLYHQSGDGILFPEMGQHRGPDGPKTYKREGMKGSVTASNPAGMDDASPKTGIRSRDAKTQPTSFAPSHEETTRKLAIVQTKERAGRQRALKQEAELDRLRNKMSEAEIKVDEIDRLIGKYEYALRYYEPHSKSACLLNSYMRLCDECIIHTNRMSEADLSAIREAARGVGDDCQGDQFAVWITDSSIEGQDTLMRQHSDCCQKAQQDAEPLKTLTQDCDIQELKRQINTLVTSVINLLNVWTAAQTKLGKRIGDGLSAVRCLLSA